MTVWTDTLDAIVRFHVAEGRSADDAANVIGGGVTRDAVLSRAKFLKLKFACSPERRRAKLAAAARASWASGARKPRTRRA